MPALAHAIQYANDLLIAGLAIAAFRQWRRRRDPVSAWVAAAFGVLAVVVVVSLLLGENGASQTGAAEWVGKGLVILLAAFPYALFRFAVRLDPVGPGLRRLASVSLALVAAGTLALPELPGRGESRPGWFLAYIVLFMAHWTGLSVFLALRLWTAGRGKPTVARRRMRVLSVASLLLTAILLLSAVVPTPEQFGAREVVTGLATTLALLLFFGGFAPPGLLRLAWRRPEERALQAAQLRLMSVTTPRDVIDQVLPHAIAVIGARAAAVIDRAGAVAGCLGVTPDGALRALAHDAGAATGVVRLELQHGTLLLWSTPLTPYFGREELELLQTLGIVVDLAWARTELIEARERVTARLQEAQRIARLGSWEWDIATDRLIWSDEMFRVFGLEPGAFEPTYARFLGFVHPEDRESVHAAVEAATRDGRPYAIDHRILRADGDERILHEQGAVQRDERGRPVRMVGTGQDITERKRAEDALSLAYEREREARIAFERANSEIESFVYSVSHDLKSPIISLLGYLDYLRLDYGSDLPEEALHYVDRMAASASYMESLIRDLLELSRIGRVQVEPQLLDLSALAEEVAAELQVGHPRAHVRVEALPVLWMNPVRARQLLTNLIGNAMEHGGRLDVTVRLSAQLHPGGDADVLIDDDGRGIAPRYREKVFGVFERLDGIAAGGTGIGLAICRKIIESLGGSAQIEDLPDGATGTRIRLRFPAATVRQVPRRALAGGAP